MLQRNVEMNNNVQNHLQLASSTRLLQTIDDLREQCGSTY